MAKRTALSDAACRNAKPGDVLSDSASVPGLYLEVRPTGLKVWRLRYRTDGKEGRIKLGNYPAMSLAAARKAAQAERVRVLAGEDVGAQRAVERLARHAPTLRTFADAATDWLDNRKNLAPKYREAIRSRLAAYVLPAIGALPLTKIEPRVIAALARSIASKGETALRAMQHVDSVLSHAVTAGALGRNPMKDMGPMSAIIGRPKQGHRAAPTGDPQAVGDILRRMEAFRGSPEVWAAIRLLPYVFVRPGELVRMRWEEIDTEAAAWTYRVTKLGKEGREAPWHAVPLAPQAMAIIEGLRPLTAHLPGGWVFASPHRRERHITIEAVRAALLGLGIPQDVLTPHGWRAVARTMLAERLGYGRDAHLIEHQLSHGAKDEFGGAYTRTKFWAERVEMMRVWASYLDALRDGAKVIPLRA